jgi:Protein of unknown function (DUF3500)
MRRLILAATCLPLLIAAYYRVNSPAVMTNAARAFIASLTPELRARASFPFTDDERLNWHFIPKARKGVPLRDMSTDQKQLASALLAAGLSQQGVIKAHTIMSLDAILKEMEQGKGPERDPENYYITIFGEPSESGTWGYRFEGHHVAMNFTIVNGHVASSPNFFGANPAEVKQGPRAGLRALPREEDLGRDLVKSLNDSQRAIAIVDKKAYPDIITMASRKAALSGQPNGIPFSKLTAKQRDILSDLIAEYANNFPGPIADARMEQFHKTQNNLYFAWAGGIERGDPHYYRIQTSAFLIEYDDTQNNANHIHSVWRDFDGDFGMDLLADHYRSSH